MKRVLRLVQFTALAIITFIAQGDPIPVVASFVLGAAAYVEGIITEKGGTS